ncbi:MAG: Gfo/Idh/MocA family oxidoreductase [Verrucomicrobiota bacterium]|nr:Gfo/Idh/MocA family oxidoreductase [Verrucomicrobiota bacterium]
MNRRKFLRRAGAAGTGLLILPSARTAFGYRANERFNLAVVGMAGYGAYHGFAQAIHTHRNVGYAWGCDVDQRKVQKVYDFWKQRAAEWGTSAKEEERKAAAQHYQPLAEKHPPLIPDFRQLLDKEGKNIDAVVVATPDHSHAVIAAAALRAGKPVFAEKPLTISAHEARALHRLAKSTGLPTQMNNHGAASPGFRRGLEVIREGLLGDIQQVHVFFSRGGAGFQKPPQGTQPVPPELDWNLWLAQLAWRDYHPEWINRIGWRDVCIGQLGNFGPHSANLAFMALNVRELWDGGTAPIRITAEAEEQNQLSFPRSERIRWEVPARRKLPPVTFTWTHGHPPDYAPGSRKMLSQILLDHGAAEADLEKLLPPAGCLILGSKGLLATTSHNTEIRLLPAVKFAEVEQRKPLRIAPSVGHYKEWIEACQGSGVVPISNFDYAAPFAEFLAVGSVSTRFPGETIEFVPATGAITNHPKAAAFLAYPYRDGWTI